MVKPVLNLYAKNPTKVSNALKELGQASSKRLAEVTELPRGTVTGVLKALRDADMIHIGSWEMNRTTMMTRVYKWGPGKDVREPVFTPRIKTCDPTNSKLPWPRADIAASWLRNSI
jgi:hypothetical protein